MHILHNRKHNDAKFSASSETSKKKYKLKKKKKKSKTLLLNYCLRYVNKNNEVLEIRSCDKGPKPNACEAILSLRITFDFFYSQRKLSSEKAS